MNAIEEKVVLLPYSSSVFVCVDVDAKSQPLRHKQCVFKPAAAIPCVHRVPLCVLSIVPYIHLPYAISAASAAYFVKIVIRLRPNCAYIPASAFTSLIRYVVVWVFQSLYCCCLYFFLFIWLKPVPDFAIISNNL